MQRQGSRKALSPTAQLLRSSRLFSIPEPLPRPHVGPATKGSHNSTLPYPIRQAITAPPSSVSRGDFGLKRNLPLRRIAKTNNPIVRIVDLDTIEHVTDYEFAADHTQTLKKVQEMNLAPAYYPTSRYATSANQIPLDAFHESVDNTHLTPEQDKFEVSRWRQGTGDLVNTTESQFEGLLKAHAKKAWEKKRIQRALQADGEEAHQEQGSESSNTDFHTEWSNHKGQVRRDFMALCRNNILIEHQSNIRRQAMDVGRDIDPQELELDEQAFEGRLKELLYEFRLTGQQKKAAFDSTLHRYIAEFLDLPASVVVADVSAISGKSEDVYVSTRSTHPSAGLSYLRSHAIMENHPTYGPLERRTPVESRVLQHASTGGKTNHFSVYGIGGVVMRVTSNSSSGAIAAHRGAFDFEKSGGDKIWVETTHMNIDNEGKIRLHADHADVNVEVAIKKGEVPREKPTDRTSREVSTIRYSLNRTLDGGQNVKPYGIGKESATPREKGPIRSPLDVFYDRA